MARPAAPRPLAALFAACLTWLAGAAVAPGPAAAQAPESLAGRPIAAVRLFVDGRETRDPDLVRVLETRAGEAYSTLLVRESIVHLMALRRFEDVRVLADATGAGLVLTYELDPRTVVTGIRFRGSLGLPASRLRAAVVARYGATPPLERAEEIAVALETLLHERGFRSATVTPKPEISRDGTRAALAFEISAGARARVAALRVTGPRVENGVEVATRLKVRVGSPFDRPAVLDRIELYTEDLRKRGYLQARVTLEEQYSADGRDADVTVTLTRGPHVTLVFRGDPLPEDQRAELVPIRREGSVDEDLLEDSRRRIEEYLRGQGYREATAPYSREPKGEDELLLVFTVKRGPQYKVADIEITGARQVPVATLHTGLKLARGQWFVKTRLDGDAAVIAEQYRRQGFRDVKVEPSVVPQATTEALLTARIAIEEGPRTVVADTLVEGNQAVPTATLRSLVGSLPGRPYYQPQVVADRDAVLAEYLERGYQLASVDVQRDFSDDGTRAGIRFLVTEGPRIVIDNVLVVGNQRTSLEMIERETGLEPGMPLSISRLIDAQQRLSALGLFRRVQVSELQQGSETSRDVLVVVEEGPVNNIGYGGGLEGAKRTKRDPSGSAVEVFEFSPRGFFEIGRRNIGGKNRSVSLFARAAIRSSDQVTGASQPSEATIPPLEDEGAGVREYRVLASYREPRFLDSSVDLSVTVLAEQAIRSSFDFNRRQTFVEGSHRFGSAYSFAGRYALGRTRLFNERIAQDDELDIDRIFNPGVRIGALSASLTRDTRDDPLEPTRGTLVLTYGGVAADIFGSEVGFVKTYLQAFAYRQLPFLGGSVFAMGARLGVARGFTTIEDAGHSDQDLTRVQIPASERFFAGGDNTVRGFAQDRLGATGVLDRNGVSLGGNGLLIFNGELRFPLLQRFNLGGAAFVDVGNVYRFASDINLGDLRAGGGFGIRWRSPVGPLRLDLGWKLRTIAFDNREREPRFSPYFTIGQAF